MRPGDKRAREEIWGGESPRVAWFRLKHQQNGLDRWSSKRVAKICRMLGCSLAELCAAIGFYDHQKAIWYYHTEKWPVYLTIQFERFENSVFALRKQSPPRISSGDVTAALGFTGTLNEKEIENVH